MEKLEAGTRCECRSGDTAHQGHQSWPGPTFQCNANAVRLVTVNRYGVLAGQRPVPMCEPCAEYREAKAAIK